MTEIEFPRLSEYDPAGEGEGTLDPLGLYLIAEDLASLLVPAVRERMARIRFLTPMVVGALVTEGLDYNARYPQTPPFIVWEWLVIEALVRTFSDDDKMTRVPGRNVTRRALDKFNCLDSQSYLKTPRVFGFYGVYKRLANRLGLLDAALAIHPKHGEELIGIWSRDHGLGLFTAEHPICQKWRRAVRKALDQSPPRSAIGWGKDDWREMAEHFHPLKARAGERRYLQTLLLNGEPDTELGAFRDLWTITNQLDEDVFDERRFHTLVTKKFPRYALLIDAIQAYETFARRLTDAFTIIRAESTRLDVNGYQFSMAAKDADLAVLAEQALAAFQATAVKLQELNKDNIFAQRFKRFAEPLPPTAFAADLCRHHEEIQGEKSEEGKRMWFDRVGDDRIFIRRNYAVSERPEMSDQYVHSYRTTPLRSFFQDLQ